MSKVAAVVFAAFLLAALLVVPTASAASKEFTLYVKYPDGWSRTGSLSYEGGMYISSFTNPGPTISGLDNETFVLTLHASDDDTHALWIDLDRNEILGQGDFLTSYFDRNNSVTIGFQLPAGDWTYCDYDLDVSSNVCELKGTIHVEQHVEEWWRWDPWFMFGLMMQFAIAGFGIYLAIQVVQWYRNRRKVKTANPDIKRWLKVVMDPDSPTRPTQSYVDHVRIEKKKLRKQREKELKQDDGDGGNNRPPNHEPPRDHGLG